MSPKASQSAFFASMTDPQAFRLRFDQQPNVFFFVKDRESRLIAASEPTWTRLGLEGEHFRKRIGLTPKQFRMRHQG